MPHRHSNGHIIVLGLGRFGAAFAREAHRLGCDLVAADCDAARVAELADELPHCVQADATNAKALEALGVRDARLVLVATAGDIEASILTVATLAQMQVGTIWAKATTDRHRKILEKVGAHRVIQPETDAGASLAHQANDGLLEYLAIDDRFSVAEVVAPARVCGHSAGQLDLRAREKVTLVAVKHPDGRFQHIDADTVLQAGDLLVVAGDSTAIERFAG
jgi:trk system potassium uptake protein